LSIFAGMHDQLLGLHRAVTSLFAARESARVEWSKAFGHRLFLRVARLHGSRPEPRIKAAIPLRQPDNRDDDRCYT
jgi:hypothetical protein